ncbi:transposase [Streptomyces sp. Ac-502]|uniref:transposase n=1 Tax=Streptomyces sp. Ac-502 TaxID=3342801 RepID=UPI0038624D86
MAAPAAPRPAKERSQSSGGHVPVRRNTRIRRSARSTQGADRRARGYQAGARQDGAATDQKQRRRAVREQDAGDHCKPAPLKSAVPGGFTLDGFRIDTATAQVTCPAGHTVPLGDPAGQHLQRKAFFAELCADCPLLPRCTTCKIGRILTIWPHHDEQAAARRQAVTDPDREAAYQRWRPPAERGVAWLTAHGNRRLRYLGTLKNNTWLHTRAAALNLRRLINLGLTRTDRTWTLTPATP